MTSQKLRIDKVDATIAAETLATVMVTRVASITTLICQGLAPDVQRKLVELAEADAVRLVASLRALLAAYRDDDAEQKQLQAVES